MFVYKRYTFSANLMNSKHMILFKKRFTNSYNVYFFCDLLLFSISFPYIFFPFKFIFLLEFISYIKNSQESKIWKMFRIPIFLLFLKNSKIAKIRPFCFKRLLFFNIVWNFEKENGISKNAPNFKIIPGLVKYQN